MKKNLLIAISVLTLVCGVCSVSAATTSDTTASGSAVTVKNKHKDGERQKGDMAKVTSVTSDTITVTKAEKPERPDNATDDTNRPEPPTKPEGDTTAPEKPSGEKGEKPEIKFSSETTSIDLSSVKIYKMDENHQKTECTYSDISADDMVTIVYAEDNTTVSEIIINKAPKAEKTSTTEA